MPIVEIKQPSNVPTTEQVKAEQQKRANEDRAAIDAKIAATAQPVTDPNDFADDDGERKKYPLFAKFNYASADYTTRDGALDKNAEYIAKCNLASSGHIKFLGVGQKPARVVGLHYDGFRPNRGALGDLDRNAWV